ncbi:uncharacterized protein LOC125226416 isoform X2 [Leguminivora glycinivorella]|uniref:uncharacterized protein LOC125226416 isoform X2 n=1 Tax=Leguminivora glycinivorella TaxID=1035111 RepID=UPI00200DC7A0|nr:uncharacterized protein LOC125226416 isoform X2 [Leguminivora glycinivorella]
MSDTIMSVQELIDTAFPDELTNSTINLRLLKTVIIIIANQLRVLNRHVQVSVDRGEKRSKTSLRPSQTISEIKIQVDSKNKPTRVSKEGGKRKAEDKTDQHLNKKEGRTSKDERKVNKKDKSKDEENEKEEKGTNNAPETNQNERIINKKKVKKDHQKERGVKIQDIDDDVSNPVLQEAASIRETNVDDLEELREREIRVITQRANSHEDPALSPSPMASVHSFGKENLLIVSPQGRIPRISVVTKEQFDELAHAVHELEARFDPTIGIPNFPENAEFLKALRSGASLTDTMAAFQMSARLQAFEKALEIMTCLLTELAKKTPGVNVSPFHELETNFARGGVLKDINLPRRDEPVKADWISRHEFNNAMHELYDEVMQVVKKGFKPTGTDTKNTELLLAQLERKIESVNYRERIENLEAEITEYAEKFINLDFSLSSQIGSYQEQLTQMQYQLETGIENMVDKVAQIRTAPEALKELNIRLDSLQQDLENTTAELKDLKAFQNNMTLDLARIWKEIELIRDAKADREEIADVLRDKAGIENLNGMVSVGEFNAIAIDDLNKSINDKGDWKDLCTLREDINSHLNNLHDKVQMLIEVVGEPRAAAIRKELFSNTDCACCGTPARMNVEVPVQRLPNFKKTRASADGAETPNVPKEDGDHAGLCIPGLPASHPKDSRSHICQRFCGGSHTLIPPVSRIPPGVTITQYSRETTTTIGSDGKAYKTDEYIELKPCERCNVPQETPELNKAAEEKVTRPSTERNTSSFAIMEEMSWLAAHKQQERTESRALPSFDNYNL